MIEYGFAEATRRWFEGTFDSPTPAQSEGWKAIASGSHTLIHAPTGSGKTLAAFLSAIDHLGTAPMPPDRERCRVLYISPMKALAYDVDRNLRAPIAGISAQRRVEGDDPLEISVAMRTGDTPQSERQAMLRHPPDILITTPESLFLMLTSRAAEFLAHVETVIVDEVHAVAGTKRGTHLALSLERLAALTVSEPQRIGLSATQKPLETIAAFLGGGKRAEDGWSPRPVHIVDAPSDKELDIEILVPVSDLTRPEIDAPPSDEKPTRSVWPAMYPRLVELLDHHRSVIFFVNSRTLAERTAAEINRLAGSEVVQAHHGSVSRDKRVEIEDRLKSGTLRGVVATSTLELGIDMAAVDLVVLVESPGSVASGLQRVGRAGHQVGAPSVARVFPKHRGDLLEAAVVVDEMYSGGIEPTAVPQNPLDVLAQHLVSMAAVDDFDVEDAFSLVAGAMPYRELSRTAFDGVLDMLAGRFPSDDFAELRPRITWDRTAGMVAARPNAKLLATINAGTIPDRGLYTVNLPEGGRVGELDEEMVYESRPGDTFILGSTSWRIDEITHDRVIVSPAPGAAAASMPFWHGDGPGRPLALGRAIGAFTREVAALEPAAAEAHLSERYRLDDWAAQNLSRFIHDELDATGTVPTDKTIVLQRFRDDIGDWRLVVLTPFGSRVHAPWALAARGILRSVTGGRVDSIWSDDGIMFRFPDSDDPPDPDLVLLDPADVERRVVDEVADSALYASRFRESAARALLLPRRRPGTRTPLWLQRRKAADLLEVTQRYGSFPIVLETYREVLQDHFDLPALVEVLAGVSKRTTRVRSVDLEAPSPFATSLMFDFVANFMYDYDAPTAERKAAALTLDRSLLADLLGEPEFRELLDPAVVEDVEAELQRLVSGRKVRSLDGIHDLLNDLGPLSGAEIAARSEDDTEVAVRLDDLVASRRIFRVRHRGSDLFAAGEDLSRLRDALGVVTPQEAPVGLLEPVEDPVGDVVHRYARTHGPFTTAEAATSMGLPEAVVRDTLRRLEHRQKVAAGAFRPGGTEQEWVSTEVLRRLRRRSLAVLRDQVEAVEPPQLAAFTSSWQHIDRGRETTVEDVVEQLAGAAIPLSELPSVLESRISRDRSSLDDLLAAGTAVWVGVEPIGTKDGRVALYPRDRVATLIREQADIDLEDLHQTIIDHLESRGASFFADLYAAVGGGDPALVIDAIWDLVWAGVVTNDTATPLRAYAARRSRRSPRRTLSARTPPVAQGRWYLVSTLRRTEVDPEEKALAVANMLLDRHGVVTRGTVSMEGIPGGFSRLYPAFASMEDVGAVRRGYFVEGLGGAQFGTPAAIDRMRAASGDELVVLTVNDPANLYGAALPWPDTDGNPTRHAGARVVLDRGSPVIWIDPRGRRLVAFSDTPEEAMRGVDALRTANVDLSIEQIDGQPAFDHQLAEELKEAGFTPGYRGFSPPTNPVRTP